MMIELEDSDEFKLSVACSANHVDFVSKIYNISSAKLIKLYASLVIYENRILKIILRQVNN